LELTKLSGKNLLPELPASRILKTSDEGVVEVRIFSDYTLLSGNNKCLGGAKRAYEDDKNLPCSCGTNTTAKRDSITIFLSSGF
jgi:hypothetical protein